MASRTPSEPPHPDTEPPASDPTWQRILEGTEPGFARGRGILRLLPSAPRCRLCAAPFAGPAAPLMRFIDRAPWDKNPSICGICFKQLEAGRGGAEIDLSFLFADVRGSTALAERLGDAAFQQLLNRFYAVATEALIGHNAVLDKFVGDEVVGLFIPALSRDHHAQDAVAAARELLRVTGHEDPAGPWAPLGVGVHSGRAFVGTVGTTVTDFTALGDSVNTTARLAAAAGAGEILVTTVAAERAGLPEDSGEHRRLELRGRSEPVDVIVLRAAVRSGA